MTPKEKAIELYNKFYDTAMHALSIQIRKYITKECALIAVDEIIKTFCIPVTFSSKEYWEKVKKEIEAL